MTESRILKLSVGYVPQVKKRWWLIFYDWMSISRGLVLYHANDPNVFEYCVYEEERWANKKLKEYLDKENDKKVLSQ